MSRGFRNPPGVTQLPDLLHCMKEMIGSRFIISFLFCLFFLNVCTNFERQKLKKKIIRLSSEVFIHCEQEKQKRKCHDNNSGVTSSSRDARTVQKCSKEEMWLRNCFKTKLKLNLIGVFYVPWLQAWGAIFIGMFTTSLLNSQFFSFTSCWRIYLCVFILEILLVLKPLHRLRDTQNSSECDAFGNKPTSGQRDFSASH